MADVILDDRSETTAHVANPGAMLGLTQPGSPVWCSVSSSPTRKLPLSLEMVEADGGLVGVNTLNPNRLVAEALAQGRIPALIGYAERRAEVKYGEASRIDFLLTHPERPPCYLEVKNCHFMRTPGLAEFPDCVAARSAKHLRELEAMVAEGRRAVLLFVVQREDCQAFSACRDIDPAFAAALDQAALGGVEVMIHRCSMSPEAIRLDHPITWTRG